MAINLSERFMHDPRYGPIIRGKMERTLAEQSITAFQPSKRATRTLPSLSWHDHRCPLQRNEIPSGNGAAGCYGGASCSHC